MAPYTDAEVVVYAWILQHPRSTIREAVTAGVGNQRYVTFALDRLTKAGATERYLGAGRAFRYTATLGTAPIEEYEREHAARRIRERLRTHRGARIRRSRPGDESDLEAWELEILITNYEALNPGCGWLLIEDHMTFSARRGRAPLVTMADYPRLCAKAEEIRANV